MNQDNLKVLILGSKPNADISLFDKAYCANATASYYQNELLKNNISESVINFVSASEMVPSSRKNSIDKEKWLSSKFTRIVTSPFKKIVLYTHDIFPESIKLIKDSGFDGSLECVSLSQTKSMVKRFSKHQLPIFTKYHIEGFSKATLKNLLRFMIEFSKSIKDKNYLCSALFRPSTGILALIYAINEHGERASYTLSGIGFGERGSYPDGKKNTWSPQPNLLRYHIFVDRHLVKALSKVYDINVTDKFYNENISVR
jgi:hypothetical protein